MICAMSLGFSFLTKLTAAVCSVGSFSSMLALLSSSRDNAIGCGRRLKKVRSCLTPSSNTEKSPCSMSVT